MRGRLPALAAFLAAAATALTTGGPSALATTAVRCPLAPSSSPPGGPGVTWAFTETGPPSGAHPGIASSYTHGRGTLTGGRAKGTVCHEDRLQQPAAPRRELDLVLAVAGPARLTPNVVRLGLPGVALALRVTVAASDDAACPVGTHGTVTLFASYHAVHRDSLVLRFAGGCADHDHSYAGASLHVLIARKGRQVN